VQKWSGALRLLPLHTVLPSQPASKPGDAATASTAAGSRIMYTTSIHASVSACIKLSRKANEGRRAFRVLQALDPMWLDSRGRVELGFLSATMDKDIAVGQIKGKSGAGVLLEFDSGAADCGAGLDSISQYPGDAFSV
jgi:hypothetical protein